MILLDYRDKRPIYEQVVEKLERLIMSGGLEPLTKMPSVRSLAVELSVNPNTIQRAYAQLEQDGYLYTVSGRGSFVTAESDWRENRQGKVLKEWEGATLRAKEIGLTIGMLTENLRQIYGEEKAAEGKTAEEDRSAEEGKTIKIGRSAEERGAKEERRTTEERGTTKEGRTAEESKIDRENKPAEGGNAHD